VKTKTAHGKNSAKAIVGLFCEPRGSKAVWFVFADADCKHVGEGDESLDLAVKAVHSLASEGNVPAGQGRRDSQLRAWRLEIAVEMTRAREHRRRMSPKQRAKLDAAFNCLDAAFDRLDAASDLSGSQQPSDKRSLRKKTRK
jgi:hypothetical protein